MGKIFNTRSLISVVLVVSLVVLLFFVLRSCGKQRTVVASISSLDIIQGEWITYGDSTHRAGSWLWEFGNGDYSEQRSGRYLFPESGRYQIRLRVDDAIEKLFLVRVREYNPGERQDHLIRINAPQTALQGEYVLFAAEGNDLDWKWEFGETGLIDSREKTAIYAYENHGVYRVRLTTEKTQYPIYHTIEIQPRYMEVDSLDAMTLAGNDIRQRLQNIVDGKPFNPNYNHILNTYLCGNPDVLVTVNNVKRNDFYSYCQGLRVTGRFKTVIETVFVESSVPESNCIDHLIVLQSEK